MILIQSSLTDEETKTLVGLNELGLFLVSGLLWGTEILKLSWKHFFQLQKKLGGYRNICQKNKQNEDNKNKLTWN